MAQTRRIAILTVGLSLFIGTLAYCCTTQSTTRTYDHVTVADTHIS
jgi:hypothetical protein